MSNIIDKIQVSGVTYDISGGGIPESAFTAYTAATDSRISEDEEVTSAGLNALNGKFDTKVDASTYSAYTAATDTALSGKQTTLTAGTGIDITDNVISATGGGGKAVEGGRGITVTTGETADTVNFNLPIGLIGSKENITIFGYVNGTGSTNNYNTASTNSYDNIFIGQNNKTIGGAYSYPFYRNVLIGNGNTIESSPYGTNSRGHNVAIGQYNYLYSEYLNNSYAFGYYNSGYTSSAFVFGLRNVVRNECETAIGKYNISNTGSTDADKTLFSVGNGVYGTSHNAFEIRQNGDIYLTKDGQDVKLQDQLGGSSITVDTALDSGSTNPVENRVIYNKIDEVEQVTAAGLNALNGKFGGLKLVSLTQAEYNGLATKDASTLYIIVN